HAGFALHALGFVAVAPPSPRPHPAPIVIAPHERGRLILQRDLQHVTRDLPDEPGHGRFCRRGVVAHLSAQQLRDLLLQSLARWYSLHGVDLLRLRSQRSLVCWPPGGYQRLFTFTGTLALHLSFLHEEKPARIAVEVLHMLHRIGLGAMSDRAWQQPWLRVELAIRAALADRLR